MLDPEHVELDHADIVLLALAEVELRLAVGLVEDGHRLVRVGVGVRVWARVGARVRVRTRILGQCQGKG